MRFPSLLRPTLAVALLATGCVPDTTYRYSAFTPSARPLAWDGRTEREGKLRAEGTLSGGGIRENLLPVVHSTALMVPAWTLEGAVTIAPTSRFELGLRGNYAAYEWAQPSTLGTMPVPGAPPTWGIGPEVRATLPVGDGAFAIGLAGNALNTQVSYAEWMVASCAPSPTCMQGYRLQSTQAQAHLVYNVAVMPSYAFGEGGEWGHAFVGMTLTTGFQNDGFTNQATNGSTVNTFWPLWVASLGYSASFDPVRVSVTVYRPFTDMGSPVNYDFGGMLSIAAALPVWEPVAKEPKPPKQPPPTE